MSRRSVLALASTICALAITTLLVAVAAAAPVEAKPTPKAGTGKPAKITWTPGTITSTQALTPGQSFSTTATFTATQTIANARLAVHGGSGLVTVTPKTFGTIVAGQTYTATVTVTAPTKGHKGGVSAAVQLREGKRALAKPLHVRWKP